MDKKSSIPYLSIVAILMMVMTTVECSLCDECDCTPNKETPESVICNCNKKNILMFQDEYLDTMVNTKYLNISSCTFVALPQQGFNKNKYLHHIEIKNLKLFHLVPKVFPYIKSLYIENVKELILNSFIDLELFEQLIIIKSKLNDISINSFSNIKNMKEIILNQVYINKIYSNGIELDIGSEDGGTAFDIGNSQSRITIQSSKISEIDTNGLAINNINTFEIMNSTIEVIKENGLNITANYINLISNKFGITISSDSFIFTANYIQINFNEFYYLPNNILKHMNTINQINFLNNIIFDLDLGGFLLNLDIEYTNFKYNKILCNCQPNKISFLKLNYNFPGIQINNETEIIINNYCLSYNQISLYIFKELLLNGTYCNSTSNINNETNLIDNNTIIGSSSEQTYNWTLQSGTNDLSQSILIILIDLLLILCYTNQ